MSSTPGDYLYHRDGGQNDITTTTWLCGACDGRNEAPGPVDRLKVTVRPCEHCDQLNIMPEDTK